MTSIAITSDFNFKNPKYLPVISKSPYCPMPTAGTIENKIKNSPANRVMHLNENNDKSWHLIDGCIKVEVFTKLFRENKATYWKEEYRTAKQWTVISLAIASLTALGAGVVQITPHAAGIVAAQTIPYIVVAFGIVALIPTFFCIISGIKAWEASCQIEGWNANPLQELADKRAKAYEKGGFPYVFKNALKLPHNSDTSNHQILLPLEVEFIFERYFNDFCNELLQKTPSKNQEIKEWLDRFTNYNPVAYDVFKYGYDGKHTDRYALISSDYEVLNKKLTTIRTQYDNLREEQHTQTTRACTTINENRETILRPFRLIRDNSKNKALQDSTDKLSQLDTKDPKSYQEKKTAIEQEYTKTVTQYELIYNTISTPINLYFDSQINEAQKILRANLKTINEKEMSAQAPYYEPARHLLTFAYQLLTTPQNCDPYKAQTFSLAESFQFPVPSAPPLEEPELVEMTKGYIDKHIAKKDQEKFYQWLPPSTK